jgi:hypothetical protein
VTLEGIGSGGDASGTVINGFTFSSINYTPNASNNIQILKCNFATLNVSGSNWLVQNNLILDINCYNNFNLIFNNNIILGYLGGSNQANLQISNNLFIRTNLIGFGTISNASFSNNIFYGIGTSGINTSVFNNNLTFNTDQNTLPYGNNTGGGNIDNQDPQFTSIQTLNYQFTMADNYKLLPTSPGHNAGTDGTDIGPFGGSSPFPSSPIGGEPKIPQVKNMNLSNTTYPLNGNINLNVKGKKQD